MLKFAGSVIGEAIQNVMDASEAAALARLDEYVILGSGFDLACSIFPTPSVHQKQCFDVNLLVVAILMMARPRTCKRCSCRLPSSACALLWAWYSLL